MLGCISLYSHIGNFPLYHFILNPTTYAVMSQKFSVIFLNFLFEVVMHTYRRTTEYDLVCLKKETNTLCFVV